jgi:putative ABC transport system substrate-binding protein
MTAAFVQRLRELGWIEGRNITIEYRWADGDTDRLADLVADFVRLKVDVIVTTGTASIVAAKQATSIIPIVFAGIADPVGEGLVRSLAQPGGNATGLSQQRTELAGKRLELLHEVISGLRRVAVLANVGNPGSLLEMREVNLAAGKLGLDVVAVEIRGVEDIVPAFATVRGRAEALYVVGDPLVFTQRIRIVTLALVERLPTIYNFREHVEAGGLMSYGPNFTDLFRRSADFVDKILRGAKPADIPVEQPTKFDLIVNLVTAKALGLDVPPMLLARADEVIE